ncbi:hypothetical protein NE237_017186 [Protea cynaroides]|uniref:Uncharacterized protein n=1 Tax=Protea cynaroides TaxID=273540 RepID=A0A9Q0QML9_9MAGN|nr:hypothetical protein NE237_017186 [Protea cynaroides]
MNASIGKELEGEICARTSPASNRAATRFSLKKISCHKKSYGCQSHECIHRQGIGRGNLMNASIGKDESGKKSCDCQIFSTGFRNGKSFSFAHPLIDLNTSSFVVTKSTSNVFRTTWTALSFKISIVCSCRNCYWLETRKKKPNNGTRREGERKQPKAFGFIGGAIGLLLYIQILFGCGEIRGWFG